MNTKQFFWALGLLAVAACGTVPSSAFDTTDDPDGGGETIPGDNTDLGADPKKDSGTSGASCTAIDFVFVIDNSGSMAEEQANLLANFPRFIDRINAFKTSDGTPLDYRIAVTTTGVSPSSFPGPSEGFFDNGAFRGGCNVPRAWIQKGDPAVADAFACRADVGTRGSGLEMPLEAMKLSLVDRAADKNGEFLRKEALLAVVFLTDEEDCSSSGGVSNCMSSGTSKAVADYVKVLEDAKGAGRFAVAVIAGDYDAATSPDPEELPPPNNGRGCTYNGGIAVEATRLKELVSLVGKNGVFRSICQSDLSGAIDSALGTFEVACKTAPPPPR